MRRRQFIVAATALAAPLTVCAQSSQRPYRIGVPFGAPRHTLEHLVTAFERGMRDHGLVNGKDVVIKYRFGDGDMARVRHFIEEFVQEGVDLLVTGTNPSTAAALKTAKALGLTIAQPVLVRADRVIE